MKMPDIPPGSILRGPKMEKGLSIWGQICAELEWMQAWRWLAQRAYNMLKVSSGIM